MVLVHLMIYAKNKVYRNFSKGGMLMSLWDKLFGGTSPVELMIRHGLIVEKASDLLVELWRRYVNGEDFTDVASEIYKLEEDADAIKIEIRKLLHRGFLYRFEKHDIIEYIRQQDRIIDLIEDIAKLMGLNRPSLPQDALDKLKKLVYSIENMVDILKKALKELRMVLESDFSSREISKEREFIDEMNKIETNIDKVVYEFGKWLFTQKEVMNPVDLMFLNELVLTISHIADATENVADKINVMLG